VDVAQLLARSVGTSVAAEESPAADGPETAGG
jgi:hypothetical protein